MQLSTFYDVFLQLFDTLMVMNAVFFDVSKVEEASFLSFCVMIFQFWRLEIGEVKLPSAI